jgi:hypothetical protein
MAEKILMPLKKRDRIEEIAPFDTRALRGFV